jgi:hypothetical protein
LAPLPTSCDAKAIGLTSNDCFKRNLPVDPTSKTSIALAKAPFRAFLIHHCRNLRYQTTPHFQHGKRASGTTGKSVREHNPEGRAYQAQDE